MSDTPLVALAALRREAAQRAQLVLAEARAALAQRESQVHEAHAARQRCEEALQGARVLFGGAHSVRQLRLCEESVRGLALELAAAERSLSAAREARRVAGDQVHKAERALAEAESGRRAIVNALESRLEAAEQRRERAEEDDAEDVFRARTR